MSPIRPTLAFLALVLMLTGCVQTESDSTASDQMYELSGQVSDASTDMPLVGANVALEGTSIGAATGPDGRYMIRAVPAGTYDLKITHAGRTVSTEEIVVPGTNSQVRVRRLSPEIVQRDRRVFEKPVPPPPPPTMADEEVFVVVEQMPQLIGGLESIMNEIKYPAIAKKAGIEGRVIVQFVVDEEGNPTHPQVVRGIGAGCDEEAVRALMASTFEPGMQRGRTVKVKMSLPVSFKLAD